MPLDRFQEKGKEWYKPARKHHFVVEYKVMVRLGPADVRFEVIHDDEVKSKDNSVVVEWSHGASVQAPKLIEKYPAVEVDSADILLEPQNEGRVKGGKRKIFGR